MLHIGITASVVAALSYHMIVGAHLQEKSRKRTVSAADFVTVLSSESSTFKEQAKKEISIAVEADTRRYDRDPKGKGNGIKGDRNVTTRRGASRCA